MRVTCKHCGGAHPAYECRKKSTAARKDVPRVVGSDGFREASDPSNATERKALIAGTQALPVDANSTRGYSTAFASTSAGTVGNKDRQPKFDKKAWMRERMPAYMRQYRADVKSGVRVPVKRGKADG